MDKIEVRVILYPLSCGKSYSWSADIGRKRRSYIFESITRADKSAAILDFFLQMLRLQNSTHLLNTVDVRNNIEKWFIPRKEVLKLVFSDVLTLIGIFCNLYNL
mmetsp:Transcript_53802/g.64922  ORF Transcript_53802/g.64922 Transcript_53802/m.64922 type:complete len:104 (+) Transcript_53802:1164-1475(+)